MVLQRTAGQLHESREYGIFDECFSKFFLTSEELHFIHILSVVSGFFFNSKHFLLKNLLYSEKVIQCVLQIDALSLLESFPEY